MKSLTETSTLLINTLQDLNQEIRQRLSSTHFSTGQEMKSLEAWLQQAELLVKHLENDLCLISQHMQILKKELSESQNKELLKA